ncbi:MAG: bifunctional diguanylate cyclase/phosphodiesterase [Desulfobulbaceae bacterium]|nr:bifunctional diguanylate cyclase/phosphodiesterase [Desulfobulbaceae bacterium]HIJ77802.1 bifunctional diguanylate cyclase/phosphodiesterase [Deltaproteobacteria bacterium]
MKLLAIILVVFGLTCLAISLYSAQRICRVIQPNKPSWKFLCFLISFFIVGYIFFVYLLYCSPFNFSYLFVAAVFCGGGLFVLMIIRLSKFNIEDLRRVAALERHRALYDDITNLPNRNLLCEFIDMATTTAGKQGQSIVVLLVDMVSFRNINNTLGHYYGDYLLQLMVPRLKQCVKNGDMIARLGGDEFVLVLKDTTVEEATLGADCVLAQMEKPFRIEGQELKVDVTVGIAVYPEHGIESESLLQHAYIAKDIAQLTGTKFEIYNANKDKFKIDRLMLIGELREAIKKNQLILHYQPKVTLKDGLIKGVEVLLRWKHPETGALVQPDNFIGVAEKSDLINEITYWVLDNAFRQKAEWQKMGLDLIISVNLSIKNLHDSGFPNQVTQLLNKWNIDPSGVILEITESSMIIDPVQTYEVTTKLHNLGVNLSIDDFGTGYSSLSYLKQLPATELKVDKSFVMDMLKDENDQVIVKTTIDLARNLGMQVVAEGVEDQQVLDLLKKLGCDAVQGYHLSHPLPADELYQKMMSLKK